MFIIKEDKKGNRISQNTCHPEFISGSHIQANNKKILKLVQDDMYNNIRNTNAFTLTEVIIVLVILGVLALILVPNIKNMMPNDHNIKYKKAFYTIQEIVNDITNDPTVCDGLNGGTAVASNIYLSSCDGNARTQIFERLNTVDENANVNITTTDGLIWYIPETTFSSLAEGGTIPLTVSLSGADAYSNGAAVEENAKNGIYKITISADGKVKPDGELGRDLLLSNPND